ncbi:hypothetical protein CPB84DRAFT_1791895, partial [Gymnopilus junonius]
TFKRTRFESFFIVFLLSVLFSQYHFFTILSIKIESFTFLLFLFVLVLLISFLSNFIPAHRNHNHIRVRAVCAPARIIKFELP